MFFVYSNILKIPVNMPDQRGLNQVKLSTQNVKKNYSKLSAKFLNNSLTNTHRREPWPLLFHWGHFDF